MSVFSEVAVLLALFALAALWFIGQWFIIERKRAKQSRVRVSDACIGFVTNFFDTLGIGSFAPTTAIFKLLRRIPDEEIPGTLNVGHALPTVVQGLIFVAVVSVETTTLVSMILAAVAGSWIGVGLVARLPRRWIQVAMGIALLIAAGLYLATNLKWMPVGGAALGLSGTALILAVSTSFLLGALMMLGIGLYAPCLIMVSLLGMSPIAAFPIMMGACALMMPIAGARFVRSGRFNHRAALGLALGGIPAVLIAALVVKSLPVEWLRWLVVIVVLYAAAQMLLAGDRKASVDKDALSTAAGSASKQE